MTINCNQPPRYTTSAAERSCHFDIKHSIELSQQITVADLMGHQSTQETAGRQQPYGLTVPGQTLVVGTSAISGQSVFHGAKTHYQRTLGLWVMASQYG